MGGGGIDRVNLGRDFFGVVGVDHFGKIVPVSKLLRHVHPAGDAPAVVRVDRRHAFTPGHRRARQSAH